MADHDKTPRWPSSACRSSRSRACSRPRSCSTARWSLLKARRRSSWTTSASSAPASPKIKRRWWRSQAPGQGRGSHQARHRDAAGLRPRRRGERAHLPRRAARGRAPDQPPEHGGSRHLAESGARRAPRDPHRAGQGAPDLDQPHPQRDPGHAGHRRTGSPPTGWAGRCGGSDAAPRPARPSPRPPARRQSGRSRSTLWRWPPTTLVFPRPPPRR